MLRQNGADVRLVTTLHGTRHHVGRSGSVLSRHHQVFDRTVGPYHRGVVVPAAGDLLGLWITSCQVDVIYNFIDPDRYDRARYPSTLPPPLPSGMPVLMHVSNFRPVKRVRDVVRVFARVHASQPSVLVMVGDGPDRPAAEEEARRLGVTDAVAFLGKVDVVAPLLAAAHVFLLPSETESFGLSALEALASGVPVVASRVGGLPEVIQDGETGILCPVGDLDAMAAGARDLLRDGARWRAMSRRAAADARERFNRDTIVAQYEALYKETVTMSSAKRQAP